jgi:hypothetical protein
MTKSAATATSGAAAEWQTIGEIRREPMSILSDYTPEQQQLLLRSLEAAGVAVAAASLGATRETVSEGFAAASYIMERRAEFLDNTLIGSVQYAIEQRAAAGGSFPNFVDEASAPGAAEYALETLRKVTALLAAKSTPEEAAGYRQWLMNIAVTTTNAGKEGGNFLGWGAVAVNDAERTMLQTIAAALDLEE